MKRLFEPSSSHKYYSYSSSLELSDIEVKAACSEWKNPFPSLRFSSFLSRSLQGDERERMEEEAAKWKIEGDDSEGAEEGTPFEEETEDEEDTEV